MSRHRALRTQRLPVLLWWAAGAVIWGCSSGDEQAPGRDTPGAPADSPAVQSTPGGPAEIEEEGCDLVQVQAHPEPVALVREYVERDAAGEFTASSPWFAGAVRCPGHVPGYDLLTVLSAYRIEELRRGPDTTRVAVWYDRLGEVSTDGTGFQVFELARRTEADTFVVVRTPFGWRIVGPPNHWQVSVNQVLEQFRFRDDDRRKLEQAAR